MDTVTLHSMSLTCERCNMTDRWLGADGYVTFPDGWSLVFPDWRTQRSDDDPPVFQSPLWVCDDCLTPADELGASWVLPVISDACAPEIVLLSGEN